MTTYATMGVGFSCGLAVFFGELFTRYINHRKRKLVANHRSTTIRQVMPKQTMRSLNQDTNTKLISPPPAYGEAIKTIFNTKDDGKIEGYRTFNGRTYAIVRDDNGGGTQMVPTRTPSAALFNYQLAYNN
jgi:hypothetical protein